jgi:hypothetical protein
MLFIANGMVIEEARGTKGLEESPRKYNTPLYSWTVYL